MKDRFKVLFGAGLLAPLLTFAPVVVFAHDGEDHGEVLQAQQETTTEQPLDPVKLQERLDKRKADLKTRLTTTQQNRLKLRCKAAQGHISSLRGRIKGIETSRTQVYGNLVSRLTTLSEKLEAKNLAVAELNTQIAELQALVATFNTDLAAYKEAVGDLVDMDCVADPTAFQASLEAARTARAKVAADTAAIRTYLADTIKPTLAGLKAQLSGGNQ